MSEKYTYYYYIDFLEYLIFSKSLLLLLLKQNYMQFDERSKTMLYRKHNKFTTDVSFREDRIGQFPPAPLI